MTKLIQIRQVCLELEVYEIDSVVHFDNFMTYLRKRENVLNVFVP